ncbi:ubiquitin carboxyl-terminal hydrolase 24 [Trichonephila clavipes]|nr:ubiquitin carboxyl-terminal hydrolase 24 [Trichonephila clavipes]
MDHEESIATLLSMGFENIDDIKKALRLGKNDINEAVSILTNEHSEYHLGTDESVQDMSSSHVMSVVPPPPYEPLCSSQYDLAQLHPNLGEEYPGGGQGHPTSLALPPMAQRGLAA